MKYLQPELNESFYSAEHRGRRYPGEDEKEEREEIEKDSGDREG